MSKRRSRSKKSSTKTVLAGHQQRSSPHSHNLFPNLPHADPSIVVGVAVGVIMLVAAAISRTRSKHHFQKPKQVLISLESRLKRGPQYYFRGDCMKVCKCKLIIVRIVGYM